MIGGIAENKVPKLLVFNTLQIDMDPQLVSKANGGFNDHLGISVSQALENKTLIDFRIIHRQIGDRMDNGGKTRRMMLRGRTRQRIRFIQRLEFWGITWEESKKGRI